MEFGKIKVEIKGLTPLLMNNIESYDESSGIRGKQKKTIDKTSEARKSAYLMKDNGSEELYVPARCIYASLLNGAKGFRVKNVSAATLLAGTVKVEPEKVGLGHSKYDIDIRAVVINNARVLKARATVPKWSLKFSITYLKDHIDPEVIKVALEAAGIKSGLLDFRPQKRGNFGTFEIEKFEVIE